MADDETHANSEEKSIVVAIRAEFELLRHG